MVGGARVVLDSWNMLNCDILVGVMKDKFVINYTDVFAMCLRCISFLDCNKATIGSVERPSRKVYVYLELVNLLRNPELNFFCFAVEPGHIRLHMGR